MKKVKMKLEHYEVSYSLYCDWKCLKCHNTYSCLFGSFFGEDEKEVVCERCGTVFIVDNLEAMYEEAEKKEEERKKGIKND